MQQEKDNFLGKRFLYFRKEVLGLTQDAVAERLGLTTAAVGSWERRGSEPTGRVLWLLMREFNLNPDWLFFDNGAPQTNDTSVATRDTTLPEQPTVSLDLGSLEIPLSSLEESIEPLRDLLERIERIRLSATAKTEKK